MNTAPRDAAAFDVRDALRESGCAVCRLALRSVGRFLRSVAYEQVNDVALRAELRRSRGLCNAHAYQWLREARSVLGSALIYRDVLQAALRELKDGYRRSCVACGAQLDAEKRYVEALVELVDADDAVLERSDGLCRRHLTAALRTRKSAAKAIARHTSARVEALLADLDEVIRKEDYRFRDEPRSEAERNAPSRAIAWVAGVEGLVEHW